MKKWMNTVSAITATIMFFAMSSLTHAAAIFNIAPNSTNNITIPTTGNAFLTYTVTNNTKKTPISNITIEPGFEIPGNPLILAIQK